MKGSYYRRSLAVLLAMVPTSATLSSATPGLLAPLNKHFPGRNFKIVSNATTASVLSPGNRRNEGEGPSLLEATSNLASGTRMGVALFEQYTDKFQKDLSKLPNSGSLWPAPWPSDYWPSWRDSINYSYEPDGQSAVSKYARITNMDANSLADQVSRISGVDQWPTNTPCMSDDQCQNAPEGQGSKCAMRPGRSQGVCIPTWYGLCHAWAPASIQEPEPKCSVAYGDVVFNVMDLKALITFIYAESGVGTVFAASRCENENNMDEDGRFAEQNCRDVTPDFLHFALTNVVGMQKRPFIMDVSGGAEVWNQPIFSYTIQNTATIDAQTAAYYVSDGQRSEYIWNKDAKKFQFYQVEVQYVAEGIDFTPLATQERLGEFLKNKNYQYILELDDNNNVIGGEWLGESKRDHPDFIWIPIGKPEAKTQVAGIRYDIVSKLISESAKCSQQQQ